MLAFDIELVGEENLKHRRFALVGLLVSRLDERADDRHIQGPHQVGHKHKAVFQDAEGNYGLPAIVVGNLAAQFPDSFLDLVGRDHLAQGRMR